MRGRLPGAMLRAASLLAPGGRRAEWLQEWRSEVWYIPPRRAARFCLGAFRDALWVRRHSGARRSGTLLDSPLASLALLAAAAALGLLAAACLPGLHGPRPTAYRWVRRLPESCWAMLLLTSGLLPATWLATARAGTSGRSIAWPQRARRGVFLALKLALAQPIMLGGFAIPVQIGPWLPMAPPLGGVSLWVLLYRWILEDQRQRCPECLRRLENPVRIGSASQTFLEWYGAESVCGRGHGVLHDPEVSASYCGGRQWLRLDSSWSSL